MSQPPAELGEAPEHRWASPESSDLATGTPSPGGWGAPPQTAYAAPGWSPLPPSHKPGVVALRPLGVMEILDGAIGTVRANPRATLGLAAVVVTLSTVVQIVASVFLLGESFDNFTSAIQAGPVTGAQAADLISGSASYLAVVVPTTFVATVLLTGMLTVVVGRAVLGRRASIGLVWGQARPRLLPLIATSILIALATAVPFILAIGIAVGLGLATDSVLAGAAIGVPLGALAFVAFAWIAVTTGVAGCAVVLERQPVVGALRRSRTLVRGSFWRVLGVLLLVQVLSLVIGSVLSAPFAVVGAVVGAAMGETSAFAPLPQVISGIGSVLGGTITYPFVGAATALLYVDLRMRREGLDLELSRIVAQERTSAGTADTANPSL